MKPKVSIVVPIYNVDQFLDRTMQSLLSQTLKNIEIIMVDDESPDNCPAICDRYAEQCDERISFLSNISGKEQNTRFLDGHDIIRAF